MKGRDDLGKEKLQSVGQNLGDNFINNVVQTNRPELMSCVATTQLRDQGNEGVILAFWQAVVCEEISYVDQDVIPNMFQYLL